ncbi:hypothetical protein MPER_12894 [Moniliophthora perniciosa FA553]|nr:hypothetical protein MPER_12894 [Moniliophthora perniciosa FA553]
MVQLAHIVQMHSTAAYNFLREYLPFPTVRTLQKHRAKEPRFPLTICAETFLRAKRHLGVMNYTGPVALSCDDTKLTPALCPYHDKENDCYYVVGAVGEPMILADPEAFRELLKQGNMEKATKLRLWCLQIPLPGISTIILAAKAIPSSLDATVLTEYSWTIITGLLDHGIMVRSYACDGAATERAAQRCLQGKATRTEVFHIRHPGAHASNIPVVLSFYGDHPIAFIQDSKHALKTIRNNLFSGARCLTFPNDIAHYLQVLNIWNEGGPIFRRDVHNPDRQDDGAACRLPSSHTLKWLADNHPDQVGLIILLFTFAELVDAYQSRRIDIFTRVRMVLRAYFFLENWIQFLQITGYPISKHCLSHEAIDIIHFLIHGFLQSMVIYRDHVDGRRPFLPWTLGSEGCEHAFGRLRSLVKDFDMAEFFDTVTKLFISLREEALANRFSDGKETASGYNHTNLDSRGIKLPLLMTYPSNNDIDTIAGQAYEEADSLWVVLGAKTDDLYAQASGTSIMMPPIQSWFSIDGYKALQEELDVDGDESASESGYNSGEDSPEDGDNEFRNIPEALATLESAGLSESDENKAMALRFASIALSIDRRIKIDALPELDDAGLVEALSDDGEYIANLIADSLPPINHTSAFSPSNPFARTATSTPSFASADFSELIRQRTEHETEQAKSGVRLSGLKKPEGINEDGGKAEKKKKELSQRQKVLREFSQICKDQEQRGIGTGAERKLRWTAGETTNATLSGNSANAAVVAAADGKKVSETRHTDVNLLKEEAAQLCR